MFLQGTGRGDLRLPLGHRGWVVSEENVGTHEALGSLPSAPLPAPHSQPEKPGEALEGLRGETANPVVGEISGETHTTSASRPRGSARIRL